MVYIPTLRMKFFEGQMERFITVHPMVRPLSEQEIIWIIAHHQPIPLDQEAITWKCIQSILQCVLRQKNIPTFAFTGVETCVFHRDILPACFNGLGNLEWLQVDAASGLSRAAGYAIKEHCPKFSRLTCRSWQGQNIGPSGGMMEFISSLEPNTLKILEVSDSQINFENFQFTNQTQTQTQTQQGTYTLYGLCAHATSLTALDLRDLSPDILNHIHLLKQCTALKRIHLEQWSGEVLRMTTEEREQNGEWIGNCKALRSLSLHYIPDALHILRIVLRSPSIHLDALSIMGALLPDDALDEEDYLEEIWDDLGRQQQLTSLELWPINSTTRFLFMPQHPKLADAICKLHKLTTLKVSNPRLSERDVIRFAESLPELMEFRFKGCKVLGPEILEPLSKLWKLAELEIATRTEFTCEDLWLFAQTLHKGGNQGINFQLRRQGLMLTDDEELHLDEFFDNALKGCLSITVVFRESDFVR